MIVKVKFKTVYSLYLLGFMLVTHKIRFNNLRGDIFSRVTAVVFSQSLTLAFGVASGIS